MDSERWEVSPPGLDEAEKAWWQEYADLEEDYCWVQTPAIQRFLRGRYVRDIARRLPPRARVLELGCGTGWLSVLMAERGGEEVWGVDFAPDQIARAERSLPRGGHGRVKFLCVDQLIDLAERLPGLRFDALVLHGFSHHLTRSEIRSVVRDFAAHLAESNARVFTLEPVMPDAAARTHIEHMCDRLIDIVINLPMRGERSGIRTVGPEEGAVRARLAGRSVAAAPRGPSPKEHPFLPGELDDLLGSVLRPVWAKPALLFSFHAAKNALLARPTYPRLARLLFWPYVWIARSLERVLLRSYRRNSAFGAFELAEWRVRV
jgi:SAM-dependent methyltransferase